MNSDITVQLDPDTGQLLISVPKTLVRELGWTIESAIQWTLDQNQQSLLGQPAKLSVDN
jgi:hypothetical protein